MSDPFFLEILGSIADRLAEHGYDMLLTHTAISSADDFQQSRAYRQSEGTIFVGQGKLSAELNKLGETDRPIVVWGAEIDGANYCIVGSDNRQGGAAAARHLIESGCRSLAFFGDRQLPEPALRFDGFSQAIAAANLQFNPDNELAVPFEPHQAEAMIQKYLDSTPQIDGIVCCSDLIATSAIASLNRHGLRVPEDVAVTGYDDIGIAARVSPPLTTVDQRIRNGGRLMVDELLNQLAGNPAQSHILKPSLVARESTRRS